MMWYGLVLISTRVAVVLISRTHVLEIDKCITDTAMSVRICYMIFA